jgi:hypothetical protein
VTGTIPSDLAVRKHRRPPRAKRRPKELHRRARNLLQRLFGSRQLLFHAAPASVSARLGWLQEWFPIRCPGRHNPPHQLGLRLGKLAHQKERRPHIVLWPARSSSPGVYSACSGRILSLRSGTGDNMSLTNFPGGESVASTTPITKVTMPALTEMKRQGKPISALTAYDYSTSRLADEAGIDLLLVGDSLAMVVLGHENTLAVTVDEMLHHTRAVRRAVRRALVVADMPFGSYHGTVPKAWPTPSASSRKPAPRPSRSKARASNWCAPSPRRRFPSSATSA